jgi:uncharacterized protein YceK
MRSTLLAIGAAALALSASGCGTLVSWKHGPRPFGGVRTDLDLLRESGCRAWAAPLAALDLPVSAEWDALLLPATVPLAL